MEMFKCIDRAECYPVFGNCQRLEDAWAHSSNAMGKHLGPQARAAMSLILDLLEYHGAPRFYECVQYVADDIQRVIDYTQDEKNDAYEGIKFAYQFALINEL